MTYSICIFMEMIENIFLLLLSFLFCSKASARGKLRCEQMVYIAVSPLNNEMSQKMVAKIEKIRTEPK